jgi:1-acyl-sn-glycerol-3-phosphate acyltransferase
MRANTSPGAVKPDGARWGFSRWWLRLIVDRIFGFRVEVVGLERVPAGEPMIIAAAPHRNWIDPFLVVLALPRRPRIYYLGSREAVFNTWWKRLVLGAFGGVVPVSSIGGLNRDALNTALRILESGASLGIFPEGWGHTDDPPDQLAEIRRGVGWLANKAGRRTLPITLSGTQTLWRGKILRVQIGDPLAPPATGTPREREDALTAELVRSLHALLPPQPAIVAPADRPWPWLTRLLD